MSMEIRLSFVPFENMKFQFCYAQTGQIRSSRVWGYAWGAGDSLNPSHSECGQHQSVVLTPALRIAFHDLERRALDSAELFVHERDS
jgi:hypothetical protein